MTLADEGGVRIDADTKAHKTTTKAAAMNWPMPIDHRLDQLVELANEAGAATRRNELAAALINATEPDSEVLLQLVLRWRRALVREVVIETRFDTGVVYLPRYGPGRRKSRG